MELYYIRECFFANRCERRMKMDYTIRKKKGYVAPVVWLIIGLLLWPWLFFLSILIIVLALISLACRVSRNKKIDQQTVNMQFRQNENHHRQEMNVQAEKNRLEARRQYTEEYKIYADRCRAKGVDPDPPVFEGVL